MSDIVICFFLRGYILFLFAGAKVKRKIELTKCFPNFFFKKKFFGMIICF